jgi:RNA polymerase primary sigma factor
MHTMRVDAEEAAVIAGNVPRALPSPEQFMALKDRDAAIVDTMMELTQREGHLVVIRFGLDGGGERTLSQVGAELGISLETARHVEARALRKLRNPSRADQLRPFYMDPELSEW